MDNQTYSELALRTAPDNPRESKTALLDITPHQRQLLLGVVGLTGEAGEVAELVKKHIFHGHPFDRMKLLKELGDVVWYVNYLVVRCIGLALSAVFEENIKKLSARYPEGFFSTERSLHRAPSDE